MIDYKSAEYRKQVEAIFDKDICTKQNIDKFIEITERLQACPFAPDMDIVAKAHYSKSARGHVMVVNLMRDAYRKNANRQEQFDGIQVDALHENDYFEVVDGNKVVHRPNLKDRGNLVGAYAVARRKDQSQPYICRVELEEYRIKKYNEKTKEWYYTGLWDEKPATMIKKVAESQALRAIFPDLFAGTYSDAEDFAQSTPSGTNPAPKKEAEKEYTAQELLKLCLALPKEKISPYGQFVNGPVSEIKDSNPYEYWTIQNDFWTKYGQVTVIKLEEARASGNESLIKELEAKLDRAVSECENASSMLASFDSSEENA